MAGGSRKVGGSVPGKGTRLTAAREGELSSPLPIKPLPSTTARKEKVKVRHVKHFLDKIIWGREDQAIKHPYYIKFLDKTQFTMGVLGVMITQYFVVARPGHFWMWYLFCTPVVIALRIMHFKRVGWQYFLLDFCYFVILLSILHVTLLYDPSTSHRVLFRILFIYANGPLVWAVVLWRNSLVFHDIDRMSGVFIHIMPCLLYYCAHWHGCLTSAWFTEPVYFLPPSQPRDAIDTFDFALATLGYLVWQVLYFVKTEVIDRKTLEARPDLLTSLRWLTTDQKNAFSLLVLAICRWLGIMGPTEAYDARSIKTKLIFVTGQLVYTSMTFVPTPLLFTSHPLHSLYIQLIFVAAVHNGASYYIEVFAKMYHNKLHLLSQTELSTGALAPPTAAAMSTKGDYDEM
ncbi:hypothetical protein H310_05423 [Aphanomyces invadans]|uniref:Glycerophosphocholine acyltransferase 1 n=1 Tax=Aphanomyces invadans TaxID=157072 RepID=A0A024UBJ3_9STRA|nr:hypothetical protein H310_05423 [Aphanomyces invadans]ETW02983.1 hypothetical protein H310_05423 [Aphanomyces invadans]RHY22212.1 hypothetical protein DYB32_009573 [Aphanomyces invadans]|eukprot:XP_008868367.1 hypothetical protein H310_05423 [Aphanomyces invadans]